MNTKTLFALIGAAVLALAAALLINHSKKPQSDVAAQAQRLLPELHTHLNDINAVTLTGADNKVLATLKRGSGGWTVAEKADYPVDVAKLREFLLKLDQATLIEQKTANPKHYAELGVDDVSDKDAKGVLVEIAGLNQPIKLIIGNFNGAGGGGTFVRRAGDAQSWLANGNLTVANKTADWEKRDLTDIASTRLKSVVLTQADGKTLKVYKDQRSDANFKVADVPAGREVSSEFIANNLGSLLSGLRADDAAPAKDAAPPEKVHKAQYAAFDGLVIDMTAWDQDGKYYAQLTARLDAAAANADIDKEQSKAKAEYDAAVEAANKKVAEEKSTTGKEAEANATAATEVPKPLAVSDAAKDREEKLAALNQEIEGLNKTFAGWTFALPGYKFADLTKSMDDMLKPIEPKKPESKDAKAAAPKKKP
jgi:hypothetical protein